jgi:pimeloyl-ACP methyl ester carboxylesterase
MKSKSDAKKIVSSDGAEIYYWATNNESFDKNPVFLHPASSMNSSSLEDLENMLNETGHSTIILDPRGTGFSQVPARKRYFQIEKYVEDISRIVDAEHMLYATFFGHSTGFMPIACYAAETQNAHALVGTSVSYRFSETVGQGIAKNLAFHFFNRIGRYAEYPASIGVRLFRPLQQREMNDQSQMAGNTEGAVYESIVNAPFSQIHQNIVSGIEINRWDITTQLREIRLPMILIYGNQDKIVVPITGEHIKKELEKHNSHVYIIHVNGKLSLPVTNPSNVIDVIETYSNIEKR